MSPSELKAVNLTPRPDVYTWMCAGLIVFPAIFSLFAAVALAFSEPGLVGFAGLGAGFMLFLCSPILVMEYLAILRCNATASGIISGGLLYLSILGVLSWFFTLVEALHPRIPPHPRPTSLANLAIHSALVAFVVLVSHGHLRWNRRLKSVASKNGITGCLDKS